MKDKNIKSIIGILIIIIFVLVCGFYGNLKGSYSTSSNSYKYLTLTSNTACSFNDNTNCINNLNGLVYITDINSSKWVIMIHGLNGNGTDYALGRALPFVSKGYNVIAPDLRAHGNSGGRLSFSYLESLDIYDWIKDLNSNWNNSNRYGVNVAPETIVVYGTSLGGATTLQLATNPDIANANGNEPYTKNLSDLNVKGFIDDCGFASTIDQMFYMLNYSYRTESDIINNVYKGLFGESISVTANVGIPRGKFDKYEDVFSSGRKFPSGSKVLIIHDTEDNVVPYSNAEVVAKNVSPGILVYKYAPSGLGHAFYNDEYASLVTKYLNCLEDSSCTKIY